MTSPAFLSMVQGDVWRSRVAPVSEFPAKIVTKVTLEQTHLSTSSKGAMQQVEHGPHNLVNQMGELMNSGLPSQLGLV